MSGWGPYLPTLRLYREALRLGKLVFPLPLPVRRKIGFNARELIEIYKFVDKEKADELIEKGWEDVRFINSLTSQKEEIARLLFSDYSEQAGGKRKHDEDDDEDASSISKGLIKPHSDKIQPLHTKIIPPTDPFKRFYHSQIPNVHNITENERKLLSLSLEEALLSLKRREFTCTQLTQTCIKQLERTSFLNYMISQRSEDALLESKKSDENYQKNNHVNRLEGIPLVIKDNFVMKGTKTTCASKMLSEYLSPYDATVVSRLKDNGSVVLGKANMDEFAMGSASNTSYFGPVVNPWSQVNVEKLQNNNTNGNKIEINDDNLLVSGGSSGGSAVAVSVGSCFGSVGSDTGGSIRLPASWCGVVGFKPTYSVLSRWGLVSYASSLDTPGLMARNVKDIAIMMDSISGYDQNDSTSLQNENENEHNYYETVSKVTESGIKGVRVGIPKEYYVKELDAEIVNLWENTIKKLESLGAIIYEVSLPNTQYSLPAYYILAPAEASSNLARYDGIKYGYQSIKQNDKKMLEMSLKELCAQSRDEGFGEEVKRRILLGTSVLSRTQYDSYYLKAQQIRSLVKNEFQNVFDNGIDVLLTPTAPSPAFSLNSNLAPILMYINDIMTIPSNFAGVPAISLPIGLSTKGLPLGMQLISKQQNDRRLLGIANVLMEFEAVKKKPPLSFLLIDEKEVILCLLTIAVTN